MRRKWCWIIEGRNREINRVRVFAVFEKQMRAATRGKRTNPIRVRNLARCALRKHQILSGHRSPLHIRRTGASPAIDAMTIDQRSWLTLQQVSCSATNASTRDFHTIRLRQSNHESTRMNTNSCSHAAVRRLRRRLLHSMLDVGCFLFPTHGPGKER